jgi:Na+/H+ antiporter NhaD/arsenite permease-like protein
MDLTNHWIGIAALLIFACAYIAVIAEEYTHMQKSMPVMLAAGIIWAILGYAYAGADQPHAVAEAVEYFVTEFAKLFLFLLAAMTYVNAMTERNVFGTLRAWLTSKNFSYRTIFWITGLMSFFLSPVIDNLTTALVMCAVVLAIGRENPRFITIACVNIVVAANAGGAFSPFGDITTLMVWQRGLIDFGTLFVLFIPSVVNFAVPAVLMSLAIPKGESAPAVEGETLKRGAKRIVLLFVATITTAVVFHNFLDLPAFLGMITGLAYLKFFGYYLRRTESARTLSADDDDIGAIQAFDSFREVARVEWDTLLFFFGVIMCVGGLGFIGYLAHMSDFLYGELGPTVANVLIGVLSALIDNIPIMVAVLEYRSLLS